MDILQNKQSANNSEFFDAALNYTRRGWSIIPTIGKQSAHHWKQFQEEPADEPTLRRMFARKGITGLAVILGSASGGLACRDFDDVGAYRRWAVDHPDLAAILPTVQTARGFHVYFSGPDDFQVLGVGEYRGDAGHYCLLPPSAHPDGPTYRWLNPLPDGKLLTVDPVQAGMLTGTRTTQGTQDNPSHTHMCEQGQVPTAIAMTLPSGTGQRRTKLFELARRLKSIMPDAGGNELKPIVREWFDLALPVIGTKEWSVTWEDFVTAWKTAKHPHGASWAEIVATSKAMTVNTGEYDGAAAAIVRLCAALQAHHGPGVPFPLSCRKACEEPGVSHERAARVLRMLVFDDVLRLVKPGGKKGSRVASTYIFLGVRS